MNVFEAISPSIDGELIESNYGVLIEWEEPPLFVLAGPRTAIGPPVRLACWLTKYSRGRYRKVRPIDPSSVVSGWDAEGRAFDFQDGILTLKTIEQRT